MYSKNLLKGKTAVITGAGTGIGKATALAFARHGANLVLGARNLERLEAAASQARALGARALAVSTDVAEARQVRALIERCLSEFGRLDVMVNNAAANFIRPSEMLTPVRWNKVVDIVLNGTFYGCLEAGKEMLKAGGGSIINMIATYAWTGAPGLAPSASAKAGVLALTKSLAGEWAARGVRVNAIAPGFIDTPQSRERLWPTEEIRSRMLASVPMGRFGRLEEIEALALYLASDLSSYTTGEVLTADGGQSLGKGAMEMMERIVAIRPPKGK